MEHPYSGIVFFGAWGIIFTHKAAFTKCAVIKAKVHCVCEVTHILHALFLGSYIYALHSSSLLLTTLTHTTVLTLFLLLAHPLPCFSFPPHSLSSCCAEEVQKLQKHLSLLRQEYVKMQQKLVETERKCSLLAAQTSGHGSSSSLQPSDSFISRLLTIVAELYQQDQYRCMLGAFNVIYISFYICLLNAV